jgi:nucleoid-associated protein EbfC
LKNLGDLMKQAQALQGKVEAAKAKMAETEMVGTSGGGMVSLTLKGLGELTGVTIDESLLKPGEGEILVDLIVAAHADARRKLDASHQETMKDATGMLGAIPGMPSF